MRHRPSSLHATPGRRSIALLTLIAATAAEPARATAQSATESRFQLSGTHRTRYESLDPQFRAGFGNSDQALSLRTSLSFDLALNHLRLFGEIIDSRAQLNDAGSFVNGTVVNSFEPVQAYLAWQAGNSTVRVGRMTLDLGKRRLVARNRFRNTINSFIGVDWSWHSAEGRSARAFHFAPMQALPSDLDGLLGNDFELDRSTRGTALTGVFYQPAPFADQQSLELYLLHYQLDPNNDPTAAADLVTAGLRAYRTPAPGQWTYEGEAMVQKGESGGTFEGTPRPDLRHRAYFLHLEIGYAFDLPWAPTVLLQFDRASGDENPVDGHVERFNTLFGSRRFDFGPTGIYGVAARGNLESPGVRLTVQPAPRWQGMLSYRDLRLAESRDAWIGSGLHDPSGGAGDSIGRHLEASFPWAVVDDRLTLETGFAKLWAGPFVERTSGAAFRGDPQYFYAGVSVNF
jgi:hypothetical protein